MIGEQGFPGQACGAAPADRLEIIIERVGAWADGWALANAQGDELGASLFEGLAYAVQRRRCDAGCIGRGLDTTDGHDGNVSPARQLGLFQPQKRAGGPNLIGGDVHERYLSECALWINDDHTRSLTSIATLQPALMTRVSSR